MCLLLYTLDDPPSIAQQPGVPKVVVGPNDLWTALRWLWLHRPVGANKLEGQTLVDRLLEAPELAEEPGSSEPRVSTSYLTPPDRAG